MSDNVTSLVQELADLSPGSRLEAPASRLGQLFDAGGELSEGAAANLQAFAQQHGCKADYSAASGIVTFEKAAPGTS